MATLRQKLLDALNVMLRFIRKLNEPEQATAMPFATPVGQHELGQGEHAELNERLHDRHAVIHERLTNAASERRLVCQPFGVIALLWEWLRRHFGGVIRPLAKTSPVTSSVGSRPTARSWIIVNAAQSLDTKLFPDNTSPRPRGRPSRSDVGLFYNGISSFPIDVRSSVAKANFPLTTSPSFVGA